MTEIHEAIEVGVVFLKTGVRPVWFIWKGRKYAVEQVAYRWKEKRGEAWIHSFSVFDGANTFELNYDAQFLQWKLGRVAEAC